jgi:hypothetical protein
MKKQHFPICPHLAEGDKAGFLRVGEPANLNNNRIKKVLIDYGCTCKHPPFMNALYITEEKRKFLEKPKKIKHGNTVYVIPPPSKVAVAAGWSEDLSVELLLTN